MPTATAVRPLRATTPADLAAAYKLPEPPADSAALAGWEREVRRAAYCADSAALAGWEREVRRAAYCANPVRLAGRIEHADKGTGESARGLFH